MRRAIGILLIIAGPAVVAVGYLTAQSASTCAAANNIAFELGQPATCSTTPSLFYFAAGGAVLAAGLLTVLPWGRWLTGTN